MTFGNKKMENDSKANKDVGGNTFSINQEEYETSHSVSLVCSFAGSLGYNLGKLENYKVIQ